MENLFTVPNATIAVVIIIGIFFLKSGLVKQLIESLKALSQVQETLLKAKDAELAEKDKEIIELKAQVTRLEERVQDFRQDAFNDQAEIKRLSGAPDKR